MIQTIYSNSYRLLREVLLGYAALDLRGRGDADPVAGVFQKIDIVTPSEAVTDDLHRALADRLGISAGFEMIPISKWIGGAFATGLTVRGGAAEQLEWMIRSLLNDGAFLAKPECGRLRDYVRGQTPATVSKLSRRIAGVFLTYASYRLDWVLEWMGQDVGVVAADAARAGRERKVLEAHPDFGWQKAMFAEIASPRWGNDKKAWSVAQDLCSVPVRWQLMMDKPVADTHRPLHVFVPAVLPPLALPFLQAQSRVRDIFIYLINPSEAYWFETLPRSTFASWPESASGGLSYLRRNAASQRALIERVWTFASDPETSGRFVEDDMVGRERPDHPGVRLRPAARRDAQQEGPRLDASALLQLRAADAAPQEQVTAFVHHPRPVTVLAKLQEAILRDDQERLADSVDDDDDSFLIVKAPGAAREVEAVLDWIDSLVDKARVRGEKFGAEDVLVVTPDIDAMAPLIASAIMNRPAGKQMSWHIAGQSQLEVSGTAQALIAAGRFVFSRAARSDFEALLDFSLVFRAWGCDESQTAVVRRWLVAGGYRWGFDADHALRCVAAGQAGQEGDGYEGTLERALERLFLGSHMRTGAKEVFAQTLPIYGTEADGFDRVAENRALFDVLCALVHALSRLAEVPVRQPASGWWDWTNRLVNEAFPLVADDPEVGRFVSDVRKTVDAVEMVLGDGPIDFASFWDAVEASLVTNKTLSRASGRITFADMQAFRWLPFKAIAVIGLNDGPTFPGVVRSEEFDLMVAETTGPDGRTINARRRGDRDSRQNNRNVFLDLICAAQQHFYVSYVSGKGKMEANPSVVLQDLKAVLAKGLGGEDTVEKRLTAKLPAGAWDAGNFTAAARGVQSRDQARLAALLNAQKENFLAGEPPFVDTSLVDRTQILRNAIPVGELARFLIDPDRWSCKIAGITQLESAAALAVPLAVPDDPLSCKIFNTGVLDRLEAGKTPAEIVGNLQLDPALGMSEVRAISVGDRVQAVAAAVAARKGLGKIMPSSLHLPQARYALAGTAGGSVFDELVIPAVDVWVGPQQHHARCEIVFTKNDVLRALLQFLARALIDPEFEMYVINSKDRKLEHWCADRAVEEARCAKIPADVMGGLMLLAGRQADGPLALATPSIDQGDGDGLKHDPLWIGADSQQQLQNLTHDLQDAIGALGAVYRRRITGQEEAATGLKPASMPQKRTIEKAFNTFYQVYGDILGAGGSKP